jgi:hypothetical protein
MKAVVVVVLAVLVGMGKVAVEAAVMRPETGSREYDQLTKGEPYPHNQAQSPRKEGFDGNTYLPLHAVHHGPRPRGVLLLAPMAEVSSSRRPHRCKARVQGKTNHLSTKALLLPRKLIQNAACLIASANKSLQKKIQTKYLCNIN